MIGAHIFLTVSLVMASSRDLPPEVWIAIVETTSAIFSRGPFLPGNPTIQSLAFTSSALYAVTQPYLYRCIRLSTMHRGWRQRSISLFDVMINYPHRRRWVKYLSIQDPMSARVLIPEPHNDPQQSVGKLRNSFKHFLLSLKDLIGLELIDFTFETDIWLHVLELRHLRVFGVMQPVFKSDCNVTATPSSLVLKNIAIRQDSAKRRHLTRRALSTLILSPRLERLEYSVPTFFRFISAFFAEHPSYIFGSLLSLHSFLPADPGSQWELTRFLRACPNLTDLHVRPPGSEGMADGIIGFELPQDIITRLRKYEGPFHVAQTVVRGRSVSDIRITYQCWGEDLVEIPGNLASLVLTSVPVTTLHLEIGSWTDDFLANVVGLFERVENLSIRCIGNAYEVRQLFLVNAPLRTRILT